MRTARSIRVLDHADAERCGGGPQGYPENSERVIKPACLATRRRRKVTVVHKANCCACRMVCSSIAPGAWRRDMPTSTARSAIGRDRATGVFQAARGGLITDEGALRDLLRSMAAAQAFSHSELYRGVREPSGASIANGRFFSGAPGNAFARNRERAISTAPAPNRSERSRNRCQAADCAGRQGEAQPLQPGADAEPEPQLYKFEFPPHATRGSRPCSRFLFKQQRRELSQIPPPDHPCMHSRRFDVGMIYTFRL
jgi:hypothetical protein